MSAELYWSTDQAVRASALQYWSDVVADGMINCHIDSDDRRYFRASLKNYDFGPSSFHFVHSSSSSIQRTRECVSRKRSDTYFLIQQRRSTLMVEQQGRVAEVNEGDCVLVSGRAPYLLRNCENMEGMAIGIPAVLLLAWLPEPDAVTARTISGETGWGRALSATLANFDSCAPGMLALTPSVIMDQVLAQLAIACTPDVAPTSVHQRAILRRLGDTLRDRYCEPDFNPASLAEEHGLSKRYVHMLFSKAGTSFGRELEKVRLERAKRLLEDRRFNCVDIMEIALRCGFRDSSGFSKRFRGHYGAPPSQYRRQLYA